MNKFFRAPDTEIPERLLVKPLPEAGLYQWLKIENKVPGSVESGSLEQLAELHQASPGIELILLLPAGEVSLRSLPVSDAERKLYRQMLPYALEDSLVENTEALHFAYMPLADARMGVVLVRRLVLQALLDDFSVHGLGIDVITPETLLLPWSEEQQIWTLQGEVVVARTGPCAGFIASLDSLALVASLPDTEGTVPADKLLLIVEQGADGDRAALAIASVNPELECERQTVEHLLAWQAAMLPDAPLTLQQGDFRPPLRWRQYWRVWQPVAYACLAAVVMNYGVLLYHYSSVKQAAEALEAEKYTLARVAVPVGKIRSPERQMRAAMAQLSSSGPTRFGAMLARVGPALGGESGYTVRMINYDGNSDSLKLEVRAGKSQQIESLIKTLRGSGLQAELTNSHAQGQGIMARLELKEVGR
jgi:type II secretion system protein L